ncbi:MAG: hypothetical protein ACKO5Q_20805, partial [Microcystaceae cyanobacterium]
MPTVTETDLKELKDLIIDLKSDIQAIDKKIDVYTAHTDERLEAINTSLSELKKQTDKQDNRLWLLISGMFLALLGILAKFALNP